MSLGVVLTIIFVVLKLTHEIGWSWWLVLLPILIEVGIDVVIFTTVLGGAAAVIRKHL